MNSHSLISTRLILETLDRTILRTPAWVERIKAPRNKKETGDGDLAGFSNGFSQITLEPTGSLRITPSITSKVKTRGAATENQTVSTETVSEQETDHQPIFNVNARVYKVFKSLFHNPLTLDLPGEVCEKRISPNFNSISGS